MSEGKAMCLKDIPHGSIVMRTWPENTKRKRYRLFKHMDIHTPDLEDIIDTVTCFGECYLVPIEQSTRIIRAPLDDEWVLLEEH